MYVCLSVFANCGSQFLLDRIRRYIKLFVLTDRTSCYEFASQFGLYLVIRGKKPKQSRIPSRPRIGYLNEAPTGHCLASIEKMAITPPWSGASTHRTARWWVCVRASVCMCARASVRACVMYL